MNHIYRPLFVIAVWLALASWCVHWPIRATPRPAPMLTITYPRAQDQPGVSFIATGAVDPAASALYGFVVHGTGQTAVYWEGTLLQGGPEWEIGFDGLPVGVPLVLYVFASDGEVVFQSVMFVCAKGNG